MKYIVINKDNQYLQSIYAVNSKVSLHFTDSKLHAINFYSHDDAVKTAKRFKCKVVTAS